MLACVFSVPSGGGAATGVDIVRVFAHPERYNGKRLTIVGKWVVALELCALIPEQGEGAGKKTIWVDLADYSDSPERLRLLVEKRVAITGVFEYDENARFGHNGWWHARMIRISRIEKW